MVELHLLGAIAEFLRVFGLLAIVVIEGAIIYYQNVREKKLYDRLLDNQAQERQRVEAITTKVVYALTRATIVVERMETKRNGNEANVTRLPGKKESTDVLDTGADRLLSVDEPD